MDNTRHLQQANLLESVLEVSNILKQRRPDLIVNLTILSKAEALLRKENLTDADFTWIDEEIVNYLCHFKCLYDFCPLEQLDGETDQARWQRWGQIVDRMRIRAILLCKNTKK